MGSSERLCLRWNDFESNIKHGFSELRQDEEFFDVTLACGSRQIKAHKVILSACSPFFRSIIRAVPHQHPLLYLRGIKFNHLESLLSFMYNGEVNVTQEELNSFLAVAEELKIKGLTQNNATDGHHDVKPKSEGSFDSAPPAKRPRPASVKANSSASSSPAPSTSSNRRSRPADEVEEIEEVAPVKSEPKDNNSSNLVVEPELGDDMGAGGDDYGPGDEENYDDYGQYGSESGDMSYGEGGSMMDASMAVAGPSGSADGNKGFKHIVRKTVIENARKLDRIINLISVSAVSVTPVKSLPEMDLPLKNFEDFSSINDESYRSQLDHYLNLAIPTFPMRKRAQGILNTLMAKDLQASVIFPNIKAHNVGKTDSGERKRPIPGFVCDYIRSFWIRYNIDGTPAESAIIEMRRLLSRRSSEQKKDTTINFPKIVLS